MLLVEVLEVVEVLALVLELEVESFFLLQRARCTEIVVNVSPNCVKAALTSSRSSSDNLQARAFARAAMLIDNSHEFSSSTFFFRFFIYSMKSGGKLI